MISCLTDELDDLDIDEIAPASPESEEIDLDDTEEEAVEDVSTADMPDNIKQKLSLCLFILISFWNLFLKARLKNLQSLIILKHIKNYLRNWV